MDQDNILINSPKMQAAKEAMRVHVNRIRTIIGEFEKDMRGVAQKWTGNAPQQWVTNQNAINKEINDMNQVLDTVGNQVVETSVAFTRMDNKWADAFRV